MTTQINKLFIKMFRKWFELPDFFRRILNKIFWEIRKSIRKWSFSHIYTKWKVSEYGVFLVIFSRIWSFDTFHAITVMLTSCNSNIIILFHKNNIFLSFHTIKLEFIFSFQSELIKKVAEIHSENRQTWILI